PAQLTSAYLGDHPLDPLLLLGGGERRGNRHDELASLAKGGNGAAPSSAAAHLNRARARHVPAGGGVSAHPPTVADPAAGLVPPPHLVGVTLGYPQGRAGSGQEP